jgi:hypothetical protein
MRRTVIKKFFHSNIRIDIKNQNTAQSALPLFSQAFETIALVAVGQLLGCIACNTGF